ncbi:MAG TPA: hypothetical protein VFB42_03835 [Gaiellaceae bacterium]|nr:hypothetical protein [Gaiellaceae bacterium]
MRRLLALGALALVAPGCGGGSSPAVPTIPAARVYELVSFEPSAPVVAGKPVELSFTIRQPDGTPLTRFRRGPGPHTGVHLIYVRDDLAEIVHHHPPVTAAGRIVDRVTFPAPGPYRLVVDVYPAPARGSAPGAPAAPGQASNFQLFRTVRVGGDYAPDPLPPPARVERVGGYRFSLAGAGRLKAIRAQLVRVSVTGPGGRRPAFRTYYGALAHAIFFRRGSLDYFHTHVCAPDATGCTSSLGAASVTGTSPTPGTLTVGVLVPVPGTWRLFLQVDVGGRLLTVPFTLRVT